MLDRNDALHSLLDGLRIMKIQTINIVIASAILLAGCGKKSESHAIPPPTAQAKDQASTAAPPEDMPPQKIAALPECQVIALAGANTNDTHDIRLVVTEIWKGQSEASVLGINKGFQLAISWPADRGPLPDGAVIFFRSVVPVATNFSDRAVYFIRAGQVGGMTIREFKTRLAL
jgi:hypothetical protein